MTAIDPALLQKYRETEYRVLGDGASFVLELDRPSAALARLFRERRAATAAFISAFNPWSQTTSRTENEAANARFKSLLDERCFEAIDALGSDGTPDGWSEPSYLVLGITREEAERLGCDFRQNAIVFAAADAVPRLCLLR
jgi:hypothetical protein